MNVFANLFLFTLTGQQVVRNEFKIFFWARSESKLAIDQLSTLTKSCFVFILSKKQNKNRILSQGSRAYYYYYFYYYYCYYLLLLLLCYIGMYCPVAGQTSHSPFGRNDVIKHFESVPLIPLKHSNDAFYGMFISTYFTFRAFLFSV